MLESYFPRNYFRFERLLGRFDRINLKAILHYWKLLHTSCSMQEKHNYDIYSVRQIVSDKKINKHFRWMCFENGMVERPKTTVFKLSIDSNGGTSRNSGANR